MVDIQKTYRGVARPHQTKHLKGVKLMTIINASDIFGKFSDVKFFILENVMPQMPLSVIYQTPASFF